MTPKSSLSISNQISWVVVTTAAIAVVLTMLAMIAVAAFLARNAAQQRADTIAELVAASADVPLVLKDAQRGRETLAALSGSDAVVSARLVDASGGVLASLTHSRAPLVANSGNSANIGSGWQGWGSGKSAGWMEQIGGAAEFSAKSPVLNRGDLLGFAEVTIREYYLPRALLLFVLSGAAVLALMLLIWALISASIGRRLAMPLVRFAEITRKVRDTEDFTHRAPPTRVLEVQRLSEDFNAMLHVIERRTSEVQERNKELARLAFYDPLTGAANRVLLLDRITQMIDSHSRNERPFALIEFDLDHFKMINDQLGHLVGDDFLKAMSHRCKAELRPTDTFARLGGDEFVVLLPDVASRANALTVAKKIAEAVHAANHVHNLPISCTASMGIGLYPDDGQSTNELMACIDAAMYEAKAGGRNQIKYVRDVSPSEATLSGVMHEI